MFDLRNLSKAKKLAWNVLRSPRTISLLKLGAALIGVVHAVDELTSSPSVGKAPIGFKLDDDDN